MREERPILFSGPMVRAILSGDKTQTRRVMTEQPQPNGTPYRGGLEMVCLNDYLPPSATMLRVGGSRNGHWTSLEEEGGSFAHLCPYGAPGDKLWVREAYALESSHEVGWYEPPHRDGRPLRVVEDDEGRWWEQPHYRATDPAPDLVVPGQDDPGVRWRPSIHMPRWASRITLEVTNVRVQRLQDINDQDALDEGSGATAVPGIDVDIDGFWWPGRPQKAFRRLWDSINAERGCGWDQNPWVWAITFSRVA